MVDTENQQIWTMEKITAHQNGGSLHRAFSIIITNNNWEILLQQRSLNKYHAPWLWTNTCCSHPRPGENTLDAAHRRLQEELWFDCDLKEGESFVYQAACGNNLTEYEHDTIFHGQLNIDNIPFNTDEVMAIKRISLIDLKADMYRQPDSYTPRFHEIANILWK